MKLPSVMIVDDSEADRYLLARMIRRGAISDTIIEAGDGLEALDFFKTCATTEAAPPAVIFLDINMPGIGGFEFLKEFKELRKSIDCTSVVVLMCTSSNRAEDRKRAAEFPFVKGFVVKMPGSAEEVAELLADCIDDAS